MLRRLFKLIVYLVIIEVVCLSIMSVWIVYDGTRDQDVSTDAALVPGYAEIKSGVLPPALTARLDLAKQLFDAGKFNYVIVSGMTPPGEDDESQAMARYLRAHGVPEENIIQDHPGMKPDESMKSLVKIMKDQSIKSLLLITDYYRLVHLKTCLVHAGETELAQAHVGEWKKDDARNILNEDIAIYKDMYDWYVVPDSKVLGKKALEEAMVLKASVGAEVDSLRK